MAEEPEEHVEDASPPEAAEQGVEDASPPEAAEREASAEDASPDAEDGQQPEAEAEPEPAADAEPAPEAEAAPAPAALGPKERRRRARAEKAAARPALAQRSPEERHQARLDERRRKAEVRRGVRVRTRAKARAAEHQTEATPPREHAPGKQKSRQGIVTSDRADKTITVRIDTASRHRRYEKIVRTSTTLHVHDERNDAKTGDTVLVRECRPLSRTKRWRLIEILERAK